MSKNYNFHIDPDPLNRGDIEKHMDFDALIHKMEQQTAPESTQSGARIINLPRLATMAAAASIVLFLGLYFIFSQDDFDAQKYEQNAVAHFAAQKYVNPPLTDLKIPSNTTNINTLSSDTLQFESGSKIIIPPSAFSGNSSNVNLEFKEMHDFVDFFLSGIPMHYDSAGQRYQLESAGMIEITASNDQTLAMSPGKELEIELYSTLTLPASNLQLPKFNVYKLNEQERKWEYRGKDNIEVVFTKNVNVNPAIAQLMDEYTEQLSIISGNYNQQIEALNRQYPLPQKPQQPIGRNEEYNTLDIVLQDIEANFGPGAKEQLNQINSQLEGIIWEITPNTSSDAEEKLRSVAEELTINLVDKNTFELMPTVDGEQYSIFVRPVLSETAYEAATTKYEEELKVYNEAISNRTQLLADNSAAIISEQQTAKDDQLQELFGAIDRLVQQGRLTKDELITFKIINRFTIDELGIWNCDRPIPPSTEANPVKLVNQKGKPIKATTTFLANRKTNTIYQIYADEFTPLPKLNAEDYKLWIVTEDDELAMANFKDFDENRLVFEPVDRSIESVDALRSVLYF
ncbi:MAG: hypothetical protein AAFO07_23655 [Bacteroidota bacterium]